MSFVQLGLAHLDLGHYDRARKWYRHAIARRGDDPVAHINLALLSLLMGDLETGWQEYRWRWRLGTADPRPDRRLDVPRWDGRPLRGRTIFLHAEQGLGDDVMFATCARDVIDEADHCFLECDPRLVPLFARSFPEATICGTKLAAELPSELRRARIDTQSNLGCLPQRLRARWEDFPRREWLLRAAPDRVAAWKQRLATLGPGPKIGISWRGGSDPVDRRRRSTELSQWRAVFRVDGAHFVNLQYDASSDELAEIEQNQGVALHTWTDVEPVNRVDDFAALIAALDLVISVSNATVHFAGALGIETWTLLPHLPSWRWFLDRDDSPWYASVRLFRQPRPGDWQGVFRVVAERFQNWVAGGRSSIPTRAVGAAGLPASASSDSGIGAGGANAGGFAEWAV